MASMGVGVMAPADGRMGKFRGTQVTSVRDGDTQELKQGCSGGSRRRWL